jgi:DNA-binding response OmpR family regulator
MFVRLPIHIYLLITSLLPIRYLTPHYFLYSVTLPDYTLSEMRMVVFGTKASTRRLARVLSNSGLEVSDTADSFDSLSTLLLQSTYHLAMVDASLQTAKYAFYRLNTRGIPVVFMIGTKHSDWQKLKSLDAYAYIPIDAGEAELMARFKAVCRHLSNTDAPNRNTMPGYSNENRMDLVGPGNTEMPTYRAPYGLVLHAFKAK